MVKGHNEISFSSFVDCGRKTLHGDTFTESSSKRSKKGTRSRSERKADQIFRLLLRIPTAPLDKVFKTPDWCNGPHKYIDTNTPFIRNIMELLQTKYTNMTLQNYISLFNNTIKCYFGCSNGDINNFYYDLDKSIEIMENIALFQNNNNDSFYTRKCLYNVYCITERIEPKKNCMLVESPPNAGKNMFFDKVVMFFCNYGQVANFNRYQQFPLMDAINRRILIWNEPMCETSAHEIMKQLTFRRRLTEGQGEVYERCCSRSNRNIC